MQSLLDDSYARFREVDDGAPSTVYPDHSQTDPGGFGLTIVGVGGHVHGSGDALAEFTLMSCAKPFVFALAAQHHGVDRPPPPRRTPGTAGALRGNRPLGWRAFGEGHGQFGQQPGVPKAVHLCGRQPPSDPTRLSVNRR